jgi:(4S)-4-hydroxy-5-phosphonooxypentane-2,3-dione isomerase
MSFVNCVSIRAKAGCEQALEDVFEDMTVSTRQEPGCITYQLHRSLNDPLHYFLYECYVDESAYRFHQSTDHFARVVKGIIPSLVEGRELQQYRPIH